MQYNNIYRTGKIPEDFTKNVFIPLPKVQGAQDCNDFRTISLISHTSKILLQLVKDRITPIIERHLAETQMGFRKGKGTKRCHLSTENNNTESYGSK